MSKFNKMAIPQNPRSKSAKSNHENDIHNPGFSIFNSWLTKVYRYAKIAWNPCKKYL